MNFKHLLLIFTFLFTFLGCEEKQSSTIQNTKPYDGQSIMVIVPTLHAGLIRGPIMTGNIKELLSILLYKSI